MLLLCAVADAVDAVVCTADFLRTRRFGAVLAAATAAGGAAIGVFTANTTEEG